MEKGKIFGFWAAALLVLFLPGLVGGASGGPVTAAVVDVENLTGSPESEVVARALTDSLTASLLSGGSIQVVERSRIKKAVEEQALSLTGLIDTRSAAGVGRMLAARFLVLGTLSRMEGKWISALRLLEVHSGRILAVELIQAASPAEVLREGARAGEVLGRKIGSAADLSRKTVLTFTIRPKEGRPAALAAEEKSRLLAVLRRKVGHFGASLEDLSLDGDRAVRVVAAGVAEPAKLAEILLSEDVFEFRVVQKTLSPGEPRPADGLEYLLHEDPAGGRRRWYAFRRPAEFSGARIQDASVAIDSLTGAAFLSLEFDAEGARVLEEVTRNNLGRQLAAVLNGAVLLAPVIREAIAGGRAQVSGGFSLDEAFRYAVNLKAGTLPAKLALSSIAVQ